MGLPPPPPPPAGSAPFGRLEGLKRLVELVVRCLACGGQDGRQARNVAHCGLALRIQTAGTRLGVCQCVLQAVELLEQRGVVALLLLQLRSECVKLFPQVLRLGRRLAVGCRQRIALASHAEQRRLGDVAAALFRVEAVLGRRQALDGGLALALGARCLIAFLL